jgi:exonuclease III
MIVCSLNVRGLGGSVKRRHIKQLILTEKVDFMAIQETKMEEITEAFVIACGEVRIVIGRTFRRKEIVVAFFPFGVR